MEKREDDILSLANRLRWDLGGDFHDLVIEAVYEDASRIARQTSRRTGDKHTLSLDRKLDEILTSRWLGFPVMFLLLAVVFWITVAGANYPSRMLSAL